MCGIAGIINKTGAEASEATIREMTEKVVHRGPDASGVACYGPLALGHRRLSILDLSEAGAQPMRYGDTGLSIVHNGEVYNYRELRAELIEKGYAFTSDTDTEVILAAYDCWGQACVTRFNGMWAFAIHDAKQNLLFCSRDRFGIKPFYYLDTPSGFYFGSEIRQLLPYLAQRAANQSMLEKFLITRTAELGDESFFAGVKRLSGSHNLIYNLHTHHYEMPRYYRVQRHDAASRMTLEEAESAYSAMFEDAIKLRLRSDVKVGTCLSGGLDSSSVASIASLLYEGGAFSAITAVSEQESNNEAPFAEAVVHHAKLDWHQTKPSYDDFVAALPHVVESQEEPFGSASMVMQHFVMKTARENGVTVLLDGQGGDETLLGYERYYAAHMIAIWREKGTRAAIAELRNIWRNNSKMSPLVILKYLVAGYSSKLRYAYESYQHRYLQRVPPCPPHMHAWARTVTNVWEHQLLDVTETNLPPLLRYEDKNSMAHSIETRLPFLDYRLIELALSLPSRYKIRDGWTKWLLRKVMDKKLPDHVIWRKNKFGFEAPEAIWLKRHYAEMFACVMACPLIGQLADSAKLREQFPRLDLRGQFRLYSIALWAKRFNVTALA